MIWNKPMIDVEIAFLDIIRADVAARKLPQRLYEEFVKTYKKISTELIIFDRDNRIWLTQRQSKQTNPDEPFPGQWHNPGVLHNFNESLEDAMVRLYKDELGNDVIVDPPSFVKIIEFNEPKRGNYMALLHIARYRTGNFTTNTPSGFFKVDDLPQPLFRPHEELIIPEAVKLASISG